MHIKRLILFTSTQACRCPPSRFSDHFNRLQPCASKRTIIFVPHDTSSDGNAEDVLTMMVLISGGSNASLCPPFMIFQNDNRSHPIRGVPDNVPGGSYRSGPKGWIDRMVFEQWLREPRAIKMLPNDRKRVLYIDNCSGHNLTPEIETALRAINTERRFFPANATHLVQPADTFIIQKIKTAWRSMWDEKKISMIEEGLWTEGEKSSGKLSNPGKNFFLKIAAQSVRNGNKQRDSDKILFARKAMIKCGLARNLNAVWEERQLNPDLQEIIRKYRDNFDGTLVGSNSRTSEMVEATSHQN